MPYPAGYNSTRDECHHDAKVRTIYDRYSLIHVIMAWWREL